MRLEITRRADLAANALLELGRLGRRTKSTELANAIGTTPGFLSQAMTPLVAMGWVRSDSGPSGGYELQVGLETVTLLDVIEAVEGGPDPVRCVVADRPCGENGHCVMHFPWQRACSMLLNELSDATLSSVAIAAARRSKLRASGVDPEMPPASS